MMHRSRRVTDTSTIGKAIRKARDNRNEGMLLALCRKRWLIHRDTLRFLDALVSSPTATATMDDAAGEVFGGHEDAGKSRGSIAKGLAEDGLIAQAKVVRSTRKARHGGWVILWRIEDRHFVECRRDYLRNWLANCQEPPASIRSANTKAGKREVRHV
jgi:hypothetical protein